jgi:hypothetical protein
MCLTCSYSCKTCFLTTTNCTSCDTTLRSLNVNKCVCPQHYFDNNSTVICSACAFNCSTCLSFSVCASCNSAMKRQFDVNNLYCDCAIKFYSDGIN